MLKRKSRLGKPVNSKASHQSNERKTYTGDDLKQLLHKLDKEQLSKVKQAW